MIEPRLAQLQVFCGFCFQAWLAEVEGRLPARSEQARRQSGMYEAQTHQTVTNCAQDRERYSPCAALPLAERTSGFVLTSKFWNFS